MKQWLDMVFPPRCTMCDAHIDMAHGSVCAECAQATQWLRAARPNRHFAAPAWEQLHVLCAYAGPVCAALQSFKYTRRMDVGVNLARQLSTWINPYRYDYIVPVPLSHGRQWRRGYNQALVLARALGTQLRVPILHRALQRRHRMAQVGLGAPERLRNLQGALRPGRDAVRCQERRILLIDDVMTTGATLQACALSLREAGAQRVDCAVIAQA